MKPDEINALAAIAQATLALAALIVSIAVSLFVYYGSKRIARIEYDRSIREWWNTLDHLALSSDDMLIIADELMNPASAHESIDQKRRKWFAFVVLNALASSYTGYKLGLTSSSDDTVGIVKNHLRKLMLAEDVFLLSQSGYEADFTALCKEMREQLTREGLAKSISG